MMAEKNVNGIWAGFTEFLSEDVKGTSVHV